MKKHLTIERLKECILYDPSTGIFRWRITKCANAKAGKITSCASKTKQGKTYASIVIDGHKYKAHHLAVFYMTEKWPESQVDHKDGNGINNKFNNLIVTDQYGNQHNRRKNSNNSSGHNGISWRKNRSRWLARITYMGKLLGLGTFESIEDAVIARKNAELKYGFSSNHGEDRPL